MPTSENGTHARADGFVNLFESGPSVDPLIGETPTWRMSVADEVIYREVVRDLGVPGLDEGDDPAGIRRVILGEIHEQ